MCDEVQLAIRASDDAINALKEQQVALVEKHKAHQAAWLTINGAYRAAQSTKILKLEAKCKVAKEAEGSEIAGDDNMASSTVPEGQQRKILLLLKRRPWKQPNCDTKLWKRDLQAFLQK